MSSNTNKILEITLIGTGGGYGESVLIKFPDNKWMIIDSCQDPSTSENLPLNYLKNNQVDLDDIVLVMCTHWHDDHIKGISEILNNCKNASFSTSTVSDLNKFLLLVTIDNKKSGTISSTKEFLSCLKIVSERNQQIKWASKDRLLINGNDYQLATLSPSDRAFENFLFQISKLIDQFSAPDRKIVQVGPNLRSIVCFLKAGDHRAILGADMEFTDDILEGWTEIINSANDVHVDKKASYFKIPHHGSDTGYKEELWNSLIEKDAHATITPWNRHTKLPKKEILEKYKNHSKNIFITSNQLGDKPKKRSFEKEKLISKLASTKKLREVKYNLGIIKCTIDLNEEGANWETICMGTAVHIDKFN